MVHVVDLRKWFANVLSNVSVQDATRAYIVDVMASLRPEDDMHNTSIVLAYNDACTSGSFVGYKRIGDWVLWAETFVPESVGTCGEVVESIGRLSYYACHRILHGRWLLYEELADDMPKIVHDLRRAVSRQRFTVKTPA